MIPAVSPRAWTRSGDIALRYEDAGQDGRLKLTSMPPSLGILGWPLLMSQPDTARVWGEGIVPILYRLVVVGGDGPVSVLRPVRGQAAVANAVVFASGGESRLVERIVMRMWMDLRAKSGWTHDLLAGEGAEIGVGQVYAEHAYTRLFAGPGERRVRELPTMPEEELEAREFSAVGEGIGSGDCNAEFLIRFGMAHTDANAHVNSLVYPRMVEEYAIRVLADAGVDVSERVARQFEAMWKKPFFAGDEVRLGLRVDLETGEVGATFSSLSGEVRCRCAMKIGV